MLHWQDAARAVEPEVVTFGANNWSRLFSRYLINNQAANGSWNWVFSTLQRQQRQQRRRLILRAAWAILVLSPDAIPPLAIGTSNVAHRPRGHGDQLQRRGQRPRHRQPGLHVGVRQRASRCPGQNVAYPYPDNGNFTVSLTSTSTGGTSVDTLPGHDHQRRADGQRRGRQGGERGVARRRST
jgi:hypothetical protein